jgi:hypothetical protein
VPSSIATSLTACDLTTCKPLHSPAQNEPTLLPACSYIASGKLVLQAAIEVLQLLPNCGAFEVRISHKLLLDACLGQCEVPQELRQSALALLSTAAGASPMHPAARPKLWPSIKSVTHSINWDKALSSGICRHQLHVLLLCLQHCCHCLLNLLLLSYSASDVMLELLSKLSVPIMPSSCHAMDAMHQVSAMQASPSFMGPCHFNDCDSCSQAACLSQFLALTLVHERHCRMQFIRVESHQPDLICIIQGGSAGSGNACSSSGAV